MCQLSDGYTLAIVRVDHPEAGVVRPKYPPCKGDPTGSGFCTNTQCEVKCQTAGPYVCEEGGAKLGAGCLADISGGWLHLSRESWGIICDALISQVAVLESRKKVNSESTADLGVIEATNILRALEPLSDPISLAASRFQQPALMRIEE